jgi:uncharacterized membrane protein
MNDFLGLARRRWPAFALVASLLLNGFLIGMLVTDSFRSHRGPRGHRAVSWELRRVADRLPDEAVEQVRAELAALAPAVEARFERFGAIRREVNTLAAAPTPDRAAIDAKLAELRTEATAMQEEVQRATYDALLKLPPETRARLAEAPRED